MNVAQNQLNPMTEYLKDTIKNCSYFHKLIVKLCFALSHVGIQCCIHEWLEQ